MIIVRNELVDLLVGVCAEKLERDELHHQPQGEEEAPLVWGQARHVRGEDVRQQLQAQVGECDRGCSPLVLKFI